MTTATKPSRDLASTYQEISKAFQDTPIRLRQLEAGWRERRRKILGEVNLNTQDNLDDTTKRVWPLRGSRAGEDAVNTEGGIGSAQAKRPTMKDPAQPKRCRETLHRIDNQYNKHSDRILPPSPPPTPPSADPPPLPSRVVFGKDSSDARSRDQKSASIHIPNQSSQPYPFADDPAVDRNQRMKPKSFDISTLPMTSRPLRFPYNGTEARVMITQGRMIVSLPRATHTVSSNGKRVEIASSTRFVDRKGISEGSRTLSLENHPNWTNEERTEWGLIDSLIESLKRRTPRVKIYHPLGTISLSCTTPPDIQLTFSVPYTRPETCPDGPAEKPSQLLKDERGTVSDCRIRWTRSPSEIIIETCSASRSGSTIDMTSKNIENRNRITSDTESSNRIKSEYPSRDKYKTKRLIHLEAPTLPVGCLSQRQSRGRNETGRPDTADVKIVCGYFGIEKEMYETFQEIEREGLDRLFRLREEWGRYG